MNRPELAQREANLMAAVEAKLPEFARACHEDDIPTIILHQDAFAADYHEEEYRLLGMAIKFAGVYGRDVLVSGTEAWRGRQRNGRRPSVLVGVSISGAERRNSQ